MNEKEILAWLREEDPARLERLWREADCVRAKNVGDQVHLRGLIELSNICVRKCAYCGINAGNKNLIRFRMTEEEIRSAARLACELNLGSVILQSGEDYGFTKEKISRIIKLIKQETPLAVTLSLGERSLNELTAWREAGADRYFLRFETSNRSLYNRLHPPLPGKTSDRIFLLQKIKELGYETGSGIMIGLPGQTYIDIARDILLFRELDLDMIGVGPYIPHPATPLAQEVGKAYPDQVPNTSLMTWKVIALTRLVCPESNIPSTTALATINKMEGYFGGLKRGANVVMPDLTPAKYRILYEIYPGKASFGEDIQGAIQKFKEQLIEMGRPPGTGPGGRKRH
ncbi:MAG: [FeFe] hydrogenase H-cluster radical SAM maturase HydE [Syntrophales bacterium]|nr:[FeFe] hydrogenase H-cluster radical SAM maturase HydE [Syntrophales bacterium]